MDLAGTLRDITRSYDGKTVISYEIDALTNDQMERLSKMGLSRLTIKKYRKKRSLDANALLWACIGQIAEVLKTDKWDVYLEMLKRYGQCTYVVVKPNMVDEFRKQWRETEIVGEIDVNGQKGVQMLCYFGSSMYNSKEFAVLLDGVISDMEDMGLALPLPRDIKEAISGLDHKQRQ